MKKILIAAGVVAVFVLGVFASLSLETPQAEASLIAGQDYSFKVASSSNASATVPYKVRVGNGTLGSIIISSSSPALATNLIRVYDSDGTATSSATSTLIANIRPGTAEQTLTFDVHVFRGIALDIPVGFNGFYTITYR